MHKLLQDSHDNFTTAEFNLFLANKAIGYAIDRENFLSNKDNAGIEEEDLKQVIKKAERSFGEETNDVVDQISRYAKEENIYYKAEVESILDDTIQLFSHNKINIDEALEEVHFVNNKKGFDYNTYIRVLLATKNDQEWNLLMEDGLRNDPKIDFKSGIYTAFILNKINIEERFTTHYARNEFKEDMKSYFESTNERNEEFLNLLTSEPSIVKKLIISDIIESSSIFNNLKESSKNKEKILLMLNNLFMRDFEKISSDKEVALEGIEKTTSLIKNHLSQFISEKDNEDILNNLLLNSFDNRDKIDIVKKINSDIKNIISENNSSLDLKERFGYFETSILNSKKEKEKLDIALDYIDSGFSDESIIDLQINLSNKEDVLSIISKTIPDYSNMSEEKLDENKKKLIIAVNNEQERYDTFLNSFKKEIVSYIKDQETKGKNITELGLSEYLNYLEDQSIDEFDLRLSLLSQAENKQEFDFIMEGLNKHQELNYKSMCLNKLMLDDENYLMLKKDGYIDKQIPSMIDDFNKKDIYVASFCSMFTKKSELIIDHFDKFKTILPNTLSDEIFKKGVSAITHNLMIHVLNDLENKEDNSARKTFEALKHFSKTHNCEKTLRSIRKNISEIDTFKESPIYDDFNKLFPPKKKSGLSL